MVHLEKLGEAFFNPADGLANGSVGAFKFVGHPRLTGTAFARVVIGALD
jgi:hypothetical protein